MEASELATRINACGVKKSQIELDIKMPKNSLSGMLAGKKPMPEKWVKKLENYLQEKVVSWPGDKLSNLPKKEITEITFNGPQILPDWAKKIEEYCGIAGITPEELIEQHKAKAGFKPAQLTKEAAEKSSDDQREAAKFVARGMSNYDLERRKKKNGF